MSLKPFFIITTLALFTSGCMTSNNKKNADQPTASAEAVSDNSAKGLFQQGLASAKNKDYKTANQLWEKAAKLGDVDAQVNLGFLYESGMGVEQDDLKAIYWYEKAAKQNNVNAQFKLGAYYQQGKGVRQDYKRAVQWYQKAANQNDEQAQLNLGFLYINGLGVEKSPEKARALWEKAAAQGSKEAANNLQKLNKAQQK